MIGRVLKWCNRQISPILNTFFTWDPGKYLSKVGTFISDFGDFSDLEIFKYSAEFRGFFKSRIFRNKLEFFTSEDLKFWKFSIETSHVFNLQMQIFVKWNMKVLCVQNLGLFQIYIFGRGKQWNINMFYVKSNYLTIMSFIFRERPRNLDLVD